MIGMRHCAPVLARAVPETSIAQNKYESFLVILKYPTGVFLRLPCGARYRRRCPPPRSPGKLRGGGMVPASPRRLLPSNKRESDAPSAGWGYGKPSGHRVPIVVRSPYRGVG